uniref:RRP15-like protein n=1 Tax=Neogobius melanostomus TaxID=47308 RepID=A0A8C6WJ74_9GOBI
MIKQLLDKHTVSCVCGADCRSFKQGCGHFYGRSIYTARKRNLCRFDYSRTEQFRRDSAMAAVLKTHVQSSADAELHSDEDECDEGSDVDGSEERGSDTGSDGEGSDPEIAGSDGEEAEDEAGDDGEANANAGWADAMAKILGKKTPQNQSSILQKNKELEKVKEKEREEQLERRKKVDKKRSWEMLCRVKPNIVKDKEAEKTLQRVATRGVVQLFNAVRKHQKTIDEKVKEVGGSERKKAKILSSVSKKDFIDVLRRTEEGSGKTVKKEKAAAVKQEQEEPAWSVLRDDFMMGATMKDWDKDSDGEEQGAKTGRAKEEDSDSD